MKPCMFVVTHKVHWNKGSHVIMRGRCHIGVNKMVSFLSSCASNTRNSLTVIGYLKYTDYFNVRTLVTCHGSPAQCDRVRPPLYLEMPCPLLFCWFWTQSLVLTNSQYLRLLTISFWNANWVSWKIYILCVLRCYAKSSKKRGCDKLWLKPYYVAHPI